MRLKNRIFSGNIYKLISLYLPMIINIPYIFLPIIAIIIMSCGENSEYNKASRVECKVDKIDLLLKDIMSKRFFYRNIKSDEENNITYKSILYLENIQSKDSIFFWKVGKGLNPDSLKLTLIRDTLIDHRYTNVFGIGLEKTNRDTTEVEMHIMSGQNKITLVWTTYRYKFDYEKCNWTVKDSVFNQY
jgi:hypothetical protein